MKDKIIGCVIGVAVIFVITSGLFTEIAKTAVWLVTLDFETPEISIFGQLVVKYGTWIITFTLVHLIFNFFGWFNHKIMKIVYAAISTVISFFLSWLIMIMEKYQTIILIIVAVLTVIAIIGLIVVNVVKAKKTHKNNDVNAK